MLGFGSSDAEEEEEGMTSGSIRPPACDSRRERKKKTIMLGGSCFLAGAKKIFNFFEIESGVPGLSE